MDSSDSPSTHYLNLSMDSPSDGGQSTFDFNQQHQHQHTQEQLQQQANDTLNHINHDLYDFGNQPGPQLTRTPSFKTPHQLSNGPTSFNNQMYNPQPIMMQQHLASILPTPTQSPPPNVLTIQQQQIHQQQQQMQQQQQQQQQQTYHISSPRQEAVPDALDTFMSQAPSATNPSNITPGLGLQGSGPPYYLNSSPFGGSPPPPAGLLFSIAAPNPTTSPPPQFINQPFTNATGQNVGQQIVFQEPAAVIQQSRNPNSPPPMSTSPAVSKSVFDVSLAVNSNPPQPQQQQMPAINTNQSAPASVASSTSPTPTSPPPNLQSPQQMPTIINGSGTNGMLPSGNGLQALYPLSMTTMMTVPPLPAVASVPSNSNNGVQPAPGSVSAILSMQNAENLERIESDLLLRLDNENRNFLTEGLIEVQAVQQGATVTSPSSINSRIRSMYGQIEKMQREYGTTITELSNYGYIANRLKTRLDSILVDLRGAVKIYSDIENDQQRHEQEAARLVQELTIISAAAQAAQAAQQVQAQHQQQQQQLQQQQQQMQQHHQQLQHQQQQQQQMQETRSPPAQSMSAPPPVPEMSGIQEITHTSPPPTTIPRSTPNENNTHSHSMMAEQVLSRDTSMAPAPSMHTDHVMEALNNDSMWDLDRQTFQCAVCGAKLLIVHEHNQGHSKFLQRKGGSSKLSETLTKRKQTAVKKKWFDKNKKQRPDHDPESNEHLKTVNALSRRDGAEDSDASSDDGLGDDVDVEDENQAEEDSGSEDEDLLPSLKMEEDDEDDDDDDDDDGTGGLHKEQLLALEKSDPGKILFRVTEFFKYLKDNDRALLDFELTEDVDEVEDDEAMDDGEEDKEEAAMMEEEEGHRKVLTIEIVNGWKRQLLENKSLKHLKNVCVAFRNAIATISGDETTQRHSYEIDDPNVFNLLMVMCLNDVPTSFVQNLYGDKVDAESASTTAMPSSKPKWPKLKTLVKIHIKALLAFLNHASDESMVDYALLHSERMAGFIACFPKLCKDWIKILMQQWTSSSSKLRVRAFMGIRKLALVSSGMLDNCLKAAYTAFISTCGVVNQHTITNITFMLNCMVEICGMNEASTYYNAFVYIRQLAIQLRGALMNPTKEAYRKVYNWQYYFCLKLWAQVLSTHAAGSASSKSKSVSSLQPLVYPLVQITLGVIKLKPSSKYLPLRFNLLRLLIDLGKSTGFYIPLASVMLEIFEMSDVRGKGRPSTIKPMSFALSITIPKAYLGTRPYQSDVIDETVDLLFEYYCNSAKSISFPEIAIPSILHLRRLVKSMNNIQNKKTIQTLIEKLEENIKFIEKHRSVVDFGPNDSANVDAFLSELDPSASPLYKHTLSRRKIKDAQQAILRHESNRYESHSGRR
ncbi:hypothetical protein SmJEL517_g05559 [Synchytrium microbalum]|uniref:Uncharacterized protein n=1 Tax=Synchytrium microbalum TaxID=1806994 RepID=A0A507BUN5_9FUNG|nr:uncharacterized protein SmJEL517_g05559 [Synchytrium microbalum]TPX30998.1 hypothetical protein SmJEL517_g05559 [Synchytrium microbalum]